MKKIIEIIINIFRKIMIMTFLQLIATNRKFKKWKK